MREINLALISNNIPKKQSKKVLKQFYSQSTKFYKLFNIKIKLSEMIKKGSIKKCLAYKK